MAERASRDAAADRFRSANSFARASASARARSKPLVVVAICSSSRALSSKTPAASRSISVIESVSSLVLRAASVSSSRYRDNLASTSSRSISSRRRSALVERRRSAAAAACSRWWLSSSVSVSASRRIIARTLVVCSIRSWAARRIDSAVSASAIVLARLSSSSRRSCSNLAASSATTRMCRCARSISCRKVSAVISRAITSRSSRAIDAFSKTTASSKPVRRDRASPTATSATASSAERLLMRHSSSRNSRLKVSRPAPSSRARPLPALTNCPPATQSPSIVTNMSPVASESAVASSRVSTTRAFILSGMVRSSTNNNSRGALRMSAMRGPSMPTGAYS